MPTIKRTATHKQGVLRKVGRPPRYASPEALETRVEHYFAECDAAVPERPYTMSGLALALGFKSRTSLHDYCHRNANHAEFANTIKRAKIRIEVQREIMLVTCKGNPAGLIFDLKNNFGWKDKTLARSSGAAGGPPVGQGLSALPPAPESMEQWAEWYKKTASSPD